MKNGIESVIGVLSREAIVKFKKSRTNEIDIVLALRNESDVWEENEHDYLIGWRQDNASIHSSNEINDEYDTLADIKYAHL